MSDPTWNKIKPHLDKLVERVDAAKICPYDKYFFNIIKDNIVDG